MATRSFWGWGIEGGGPSPEQRAGITQRLSARFGGLPLEAEPPPHIDGIRLRPPRVAAPAALGELLSREPAERAGHSYGKSYRDLVRGFRGDFPNPPDLVAFPRDESDVVAILDWCGSSDIAVIPYGGGSSVVGGVEPEVGDGYAGSVSLDLGRLDRVLEVDRSSRSARIQAGALGPALEDQLRPHGLTLRHFPQSFEFSTLGGWIATRSGGHYASLYTHIDDFVQGLRVVTPTGISESRRLPASGAGPSPDRLFIGSEGALGVIVEAWMRLQDRPTHRASAIVRFVGEEGFLAGAEAVRALAQSGLQPTNCRLLDPLEARTADAGKGEEAVLVLGFESADHSQLARRERALELCADHGGLLPPEPRGPSEGSHRSGPAGAWRKAFLQAPYVRDLLVSLGIIAETFETAVTWDRFESFHRGVMQATEDAVKRVCGEGAVTCRFTHVYPDGAAPYYSVLAPARRGSELEQWDEIKQAASEALLRLGGSITHHHAVGRDHRPWYDRQRPDPFGRALAAAKDSLDPAGILNPGVLLDPRLPGAPGGA